MHILSKRLEREGPSGLFFQMFEDNVDCVSRPIKYIPIHKNKSFIQNNILNFLPEEVVIMSSCNGPLLMGFSVAGVASILLMTVIEERKIGRQRKW